MNHNRYADDKENAQINCVFIAFYSKLLIRLIILYFIPESVHHTQSFIRKIYKYLCGYRGFGVEDFVAVEGVFGVVDNLSVGACIADIFGISKCHVRFKHKVDVKLSRRFVFTALEYAHCINEEVRALLGIVELEELVILG